MNTFYSFLLVSILFNSSSNGMLEWLFGDKTGSDDHLKTEGKDSQSAIRFEVLSSDQKFLDFAQTLSDLSPLDACYNVVIYNLKKRCGELSEEELGKLSVQLLNCQSEVEDRPVFVCTDSMTLADCTKSMDGTIWNSYQIVGNRARAMCYANQQTQFRRLTERTVNRLVEAAGDQLKTLDQLQSGQEQLSSLTSETVRKLYDSQLDLLSTQNSLREAHEDIFKHIAGNVKEIMQEKALIAAGNRELATMTENIKEKLDSTAKQIQDREQVELEKHQRILTDLREIQDNTEASVLKLELNLNKLLDKYSQLELQYSGLAANLKKVNGTMSYLMSAVETMRRHLDDRIAWITQILGGADNKLSSLTCCLLHMAYFFLLAVTASFLQISVPVRLTMLAIIVGNVAAELSYDHSLDFAGLTVFLCCLYFGFKIIIVMGKRFQRHTCPTSASTGARWRLRSSDREPLSSEEMSTLMDLLQRFSAHMEDGLRFASVSPVINGSVVHDTSLRPPTPPSRLSGSQAREEPDVQLDELSFNEVPSITRQTLLSHLGSRSSRSSSRASTPIASVSRSSTPSVSSRCLANTVAGTQCRLPAVANSDFCRRHT